MTKTRSGILTGAITATLLLCAVPAEAGPYGDALGKCLVSATTSAEKTTLVRWMFSMMALHPDVQDVASVTPEERTAIAKQTARLFEKVLMETCRTQAQDAVRYEGASTLESSFSLLGQVAARELFADPKVEAGLSEFTNFIDAEKLRQALETTKPE